MTQPRSSPGRGWVVGRRGTLIAAAVAVVVVAVVAAVLFVPDWLGGNDPTTSPAPTATTPSAEPSPSPEQPADCVVGRDLVNPCRPWFGATANGYPEAREHDKLDQMRDFERRVGRRMDVARTYHVVGDNQLSETDRYYAGRPGTLLLTSWQPTGDWSRADGSDPEINAAIDEMARSVKSLGDTRIMFSVFHEPENDLSTAPMCPPGTPVQGQAGTAEEYRTMWRTVRDRFDAAGVNNVVWVMNYMGYHAYNCMIDAVYPGDDLVDWILFNAYDQGDTDVDFGGEVANMYDQLLQRSTPRHDYASKPWGLAEWGIYDSSQRSAYRYYAQARASVESEEYPKLKLYSIFDSADPNTGDGSYRVAFGTNGRRDQREQRAFNDFARSPALNGPWTKGRSGQG